MATARERRLQEASTRTHANHLDVLRAMAYSLSTLIENSSYRPPGQLQTMKARLDALRYAINTLDTGNGAA